MRIEIIRPNEDLLFPRGDGERPDSRHDIADHLAWAELLHEPTVFRVQPAVPVHAGEVETEFALLLTVDDVGIVLASEDLEWKRAKFALRADVCGFVQNCLGVGILI